MIDPSDTNSTSQTPLAFKGMFTHKIRTEICGLRPVAKCAPLLFILNKCERTLKGSIGYHQSASKKKTNIVLHAALCFMSNFTTETPNKASDADRNIAFPYVWSRLCWIPFCITVYGYPRMTLPTKIKKYLPYHQGWK